MGANIFKYVLALTIFSSLSQVQAVCKKPTDKKQPESCVQFWSTLQEARSVIEGTPSGKRLLGTLGRERVSIVADPIESPTVFSALRQLPSIGQFNLQLNRIEVRTHDGSGPIAVMPLASLIVHEAQHASDRFFFNGWFDRLPSAKRSAIGKYYEDLRQRRISFGAIPRSDRAAITERTMLSLVGEARAYLAECEFHDAVKDWSGSGFLMMAARKNGPDGASVACTSSRLVADLIIEFQLAVNYEFTGTLTGRQLAVAYCHALEEPLKDPSRIINAIRDSELPPGCFLAGAAVTPQVPETPGVPD